MASKSSVKKLLQRQQQFVSIEVTNELIDTGDELKGEHDKVVRQWKHKMTFKAQRTQGKSYQVVKIIPQGKNKKIWYYVDLGTKPHIIRAKNKPFLKFQSGYSARTAPVAKFNQGTGQKFGAWKQKREVHHPGTKARKFSETFFKELTPPFLDRIQAAVKRGLNKANR